MQHEESPPQAGAADVHGGDEQPNEGAGAAQQAPIGVVHARAGPSEAHCGGEPVLGGWEGAMVGNAMVLRQHQSGGIAGMLLLGIGWATCVGSNGTYGNGESGCIGAGDTVRTGVCMCWRLAKPVRGDIWPCGMVCCHTCD